MNKYDSIMSYLFLNFVNIKNKVYFYIFLFIFIFISRICLFQNFIQNFMLCLDLNFFRRQKNKERRDNMSSEFESKVLEKLESFDRKFDAIDKKFETIDKKFEAIDKRFDTMDAKFDGLNRKIDFVDQKLTKRIDNVSTKLDYTNNNVAKILQEQIKTREEISKDKKKNNKKHKLYEYEINNLKKYVIC